MMKLDTLGKTAGAIAAIAGAAYGAWWFGDVTGLRPVTKHELVLQGWWNRRLTLLDKRHEGSITAFENGELCGLGRALDVDDGGCEFVK